VRFRIRHAVFGAFLGVLGLLVLLIVGFVGRGLRGDLLETYRTELRREMDLASWIVERTAGRDADAVAREITERIGYRVSLIDTTGVVLGDSYVEPGRMGEVENHRARPEVVGALSGEDLTFAERTSATVGVRLLYAARLVRFLDRPVVLRVAAPLDTVEGTVDRVQRTVALTGLAATVLALLVAYWLSHLLTRPLVLLVDRARLLAAGDLSARVPLVRGIAELADLARAVNRLTEQLQTRLSEMRRDRDEMGALIDTMAEGVLALTDDARVLRANRAAHTLLELPHDMPPFAPVGALVRHEELRGLLEESVVLPLQTREIQVRDRVLLVASRRLDLGGAVTTFLDVTETRRLERVRRDFVANASHELKTPLTSIRGFAETLLEGDPPPPLKEQFLRAIRDNSLRLQRLVEDLLDLSRLESGGWSATREEVSVAAVAEEAWAQYEDAASERDIEFEIGGDVVATADSRGLVQIFRNLMENALRHTEDGGHIRLTVSTPVPGLAEVAFGDDGEGIPSRALPRIFERFYRADSSRARDIGGTGLGLAIVRHLVEAMGGQVWAESELGKGTTIRFTLPVKTP